MRKADIGDPARLTDAVKQQVTHEAIHVFDGDREIAVVLSRERYIELLMKDIKGDVNPLVVELLHESVKKNASLYQALAKLG